MKIVLLRVGIDKGCGGCLGPVFKDGNFEFVPIPANAKKIDKKLHCPTYAEIKGIKTGMRLSEFVPSCLHNQAVHYDPDFKTFTYGDPTRLKASLRKLTAGDLLVFYAGLQPWNSNSPAALYLIGCFTVKEAIRVRDKAKSTIKLIQREHYDNWHVQFEKLHEKSALVIVKGGKGSRLFKKAVLLSEKKDHNGKEKKYYRSVDCISDKMQKHFGDFQGKICFERSGPRWVRPDFIQKASKFINSLA